MVLVDKEVADRLKPASTRLVKLRIAVEGYVLDTDEIYDGIPAEEVPELKVFLKDVAPYLSAALHAVELFQRQIETRKHLRREDAYQAFTPMIQLTRIFANDMLYHLRFTWDGVIFLEREESVMVKSARKCGLDFSGLHVYEIVGEVNEMQGR